MKKLLICLVLLLTLALVLLTSCNDSEIPSGMKYASKPDLSGYTMFVPESWVLDVGTETVTVAHASKRDRTGVSIQRLNYESAADWWTDMKVSINENLKDTWFSEKESTVIGGLNALKYTVTGTWGENGYHKLELYGVEKGDFVYSIIVTYPIYKDKNGTKTYTDSYQAQDVQKVLDNLSFSDTAPSGASEPGYISEDTKEGMKRASDPEIFDYNLFVPSDWTVESTLTEATSNVSSAYVYTALKGINVNVMQWNVSSTSYDEWWYEYVLQLENSFADVELSDPALIDIQIDSKDGKCAKFSASLSGSEYNYEIYAVIHKASVHVITFTVKGEDSFENYRNDVDAIIGSFYFD